MAPVAGRPFLFHLLDRLANWSTPAVVLSVGYKAQTIVDAVGAAYKGMPVRYAVEDVPLGTGGGICLAADVATTDTILVLNGDTFADLDLPAFLAAHRKAGRPLSLALAEVEDTARYGRVALTGDRITGFGEKGKSGAGLINAGVYAVERSMLSAFRREGAFSFETDILMAELETIAPFGMPFAGRFIDIGVPEDYALAQDLLRA
jgi:D-glycero-alpha-D-manno-heptose 1-phosphate guanylyltransferase